MTYVPVREVVTRRAYATVKVLAVRIAVATSHRWAPRWTAGGQLFARLSVEAAAALRDVLTVVLDGPDQVAS